MAPLLTATMAVALGLLLPPKHAGETGLDPLAQWPQWRGPLGTGVKYLRNRNARVTQARGSASRAQTTPLNRTARSEFQIFQRSPFPALSISSVVGSTMHLIPSR